MTVAQARSAAHVPPVAEHATEQPHGQNRDGRAANGAHGGRSREYDDALAMLTADKKPESARVYCSHLNAWWQWCEINQRTPLPADPSDLAEHIRALRNAGMRTGTIRQRACAVVGAAHRLAGLDDPAMSPSVRAVLDELEATPLPAERGSASLGEALAGLTVNPRGRGSRSLLNALRQAGVSSDEMHGLDWGDITYAPDGRASLDLRTGKDSVMVSRRATDLLREMSGKLDPVADGRPERRQKTRRRHASARIGSAQRAAKAARRRRSSLRYLEGIVRQGRSPEAIAGDLRVKCARVHHWLERRSMPPPYLGLALIELDSRTPRPRAPRSVAGARLAAWMATHSSNAREISDLLGVSQTTVTNWLRERTSPPPFVMLALAASVRRTHFRRIRTVGR